eukprot:342525_1
MTVNRKGTQRELEQIQQENERLKQKIIANNRMDASNIITVYLHFGVGLSKTSISLETTAHNYYHGNTRSKPIVAGGRNQLHTSLPLNTIVSKLTSTPYNYQLQISHDAGSYICNLVYYHSLYHAK